MTELDERLKLLDRIEAPDLWTEVRTRDPRRTGEPHSWNRAVAIAVAAVVATVGIALVARAFLAGGTRHEPVNPGPRANGGIAFLHGANGRHPVIYLVNDDGSGLRPLTPISAAAGPMAWSPDGSKLAFTRTTGGPTFATDTQDLYVMRADGTQERRLFACALGCREPAWSPDGQWIAFVWRDDIYAIHPDGSRLRRLTHSQTPLGDGHPAWSPDGTRIAFIVLRVQPYDLPGVFVMNADGSHVRRLTNCLPSCVQSLPAWSPDGRTIAFSGQTDVFVMAATGGPSGKLTDCGAIPDCIDALDPTWSPDGRLIVFEVERDGGRRSLYLINADGTGLRQLTFHDDDCCASWQSLPSSSSTEHSSVAANGEIWAGVGGGDGPSFEYSVQPDGSGKTLLFSDGRDPSSPPGTVNPKALGADFSFSPDGSRVAFLHGTNFDPGRGQFSGIFAMNLDGSALTQLTSDGEVDSGPAWSPDGTGIAYASDRAGPFSEGAGCWATSLCPGDIHVMNSDGSADVQLTDDPADDSQPAWSPDGRRIAFVSRRDDPKGDIFVMNADGSGLTQLTSGTEFDMAPRWSPDGSRIAFLSYRDGAWDVDTMVPDGSDLRRLTDTGVPDSPFSFAWSPDGTQMAYTDGSSIYVIGADGTNQRRIAEFLSFGVGGLAWRPVPAG
jgi:Tol biopolymer transport system component